MTLLWGILAACGGPKATPVTAPAVAAEFRLPPATSDGVTLGCVIRIVQPPAVTVRMTLHNGTDHTVVVANSTSPMHVVRAQAPTELRVFRGPTANPSAEEDHLLLRDPSKFQTLAAGASLESRGGFTMRPSTTGVFFEPGDSAEDFLPLGCAASWWDETAWSPDHIDAGNVARSGTVEFRGAPTRAEP